MRQKLFYAINVCLPAEPPSVSPELVWFTDQSYHGFEPVDMTLQWDPFNLTQNRDAGVSISLWGYRVRHMFFKAVFFFFGSPCYGLKTISIFHFI